MIRPALSTSLLFFVLCLLATNRSEAQNVQLFYDTGRGCATSTVEMFRPDAGGNTFFFVDFDYAPKAISAYWEIARELNFWQDSPLDWLSVHLEYNGGLSNTVSFDNAFLGGLTYSGHSSDFSKTWSLSVLYKAIPGLADDFGGLHEHTFQITGVCVVDFARGWCTFTSFFDLSRELRPWQEVAYIFVTEPQIWVNLNQIRGWEHIRLSLGAELELSANFLGKGFFAMPAVGAKWTF